MSQSVQGPRGPYTPDNFFTTGLPSLDLVKDDIDAKDRRRLAKMEPPGYIPLYLANSPTTAIKGIGPTRAKELSQLGINSVGDVTFSEIDPSAISSKGTRDTFERVRTNLKNSVAVG